MSSKKSNPMEYPPAASSDDDSSSEGGGSNASSDSDEPISVTPPAIQPESDSDDDSIDESNLLATIPSSSNKRPNGEVNGNVNFKKAKSNGEDSDTIKKQLFQTPNGGKMEEADNGYKIGFRRIENESNSFLIHGLEKADVEKVAGLQDRWKDLHIRELELFIEKAKLTLEVAELALQAALADHS